MSKFQSRWSNVWHLLVTMLVRIYFVSEVEDNIFCPKLYMQKAFVRKDSL